MESLKVLRTCTGAMNRSEDEDEDENEEDEKRFVESFHSLCVPGFTTSVSLPSCNQLSYEISASR